MLPKMPAFTFNHVNQPDKLQDAPENTKANFDSRGNEIKDFIDNTLTPAIEQDLATKETPTGAQIKADTAESNANTYTDQEVADASQEAVLSANQYTDQQKADIAGAGRTTETLKGNADAISAHLAETVSQVISINRDVSITGVQRVVTLKKVKSMVVLYMVNNTKKQGIGVWSDGGFVFSIYQRLDNVNFSNSDKITIFDSTSMYSQASISNVDDTGFDLNWTKTGTPTGTVMLYMLVSYHGGA